MGIDVYEEEAELFFKNLSDKIIQDDVFARLLTFPNVLISGHQAFFTVNALNDIANATLQNASDAENGLSNENSLS
ncbi:D-lactate dehydrogenase [compost metagenome]